MADDPAPRGRPADLDVSTPHAARIWNYWMGGEDHFPPDRAAGDAVAGVYPDIITMARQSRRFLIRTVSHLAGTGTRQFLDIGTGLPTMQNTHEVARRIVPDARTVYVDNDPLVLAHAGTLLAPDPEGSTRYVHADYHDPHRIIAEAAAVLDFTQPISVMFMGVLGYEPDLDEVRSIVARVLAVVSSGSHLTLWDGTDTGDAVVEGGDQLVESGGAPYVLRSPGQLARCFEGLELLDPGLVPITLWRPDEPGAAPIDAYGGVARKP